MNFIGTTNYYISPDLPYPEPNMLSPDGKKWSDGSNYSDHKSRHCMPRGGMRINIIQRRMRAFDANLEGDGERPAADNSNLFLPSKIAQFAL